LQAVVRESDHELGPPEGDMAKTKKATTKNGKTGKGLSTVGGAAAGAAAGALLGPIGAAVGAVVGGVVGATARGGKATKPKSTANGSAKTAKRPAAKKRAKSGGMKKTTAKRKG
jgi:phage tail tape-measure protein